MLPSRQVTICLILWPDGYAHHSKTDYVYNIVFFLITYMLPLILMAFCYGRMGVYLWGSKNLGEENEALRQNYLKKKKVIIILIEFLCQKFTINLVAGCENVWVRSGSLCHLLVTLPCLLFVHLPSQRCSPVSFDQARLFGYLLGCHE